MKKKCKPVCKLCDKLIISSAVNFETATNSLLVQIPAGAYRDGYKYCLVVAQAIPAATTIGAQVYITIGTGTERYPLVKKNCAQLTACGLRTRTKYSTCVDTSATSGVFRLLGNTCCEPCNDLPSINGTSPSATGGEPNA